MAVRIMSSCCWVSVVYLFLLACFLQARSEKQVFRQAPHAHNMLLRSKRANTFLLEEILQGNLERECFEERCNFEEAREYFEDTKKTIAFWTVYLDGDQCDPNPCLHGGNCTDLTGGFHCSCSSPYHGSVCEHQRMKAEIPSASQIITPEMKKCPTEGPAACQQLCVASYRSFTCSCLPGFKLHSDRRTCLPEVEFPCGRLPDKFNTSETMCRHGNCPWQVSVQDTRGEQLCAGAVLGPHSILTTAHCLLLDSGSELQPSDVQVIAGNYNIPVQALYFHDRFRTDNHDNDLALLELAAPLPFGPAVIQLCLPTKDFSENVLMHSGRMGVIEEKEGVQNLVYMTLDECRSQLNVSYTLSNKMFCMTKKNGIQIQGNPDGPPGNQNNAQDRPKGHVKNMNEVHWRSHNKDQTPNGHLGSNRGATRMMAGHTENTGHNQTRAQDMPNGAQTDKSIHEPSEDGGRQCVSLLPGAPVATVKHGTAYLTGLMISSSADCSGGSGPVFAKLSRYLSWIRERLEAAENHMTSQIREYPQAR